MTAQPDTACSAACQPLLHVWRSHRWSTRQSHGPSYT
jgi:hypothetical protein